jgi:Flp pilus assembly pilin Flp
MSTRGLGGALETIATIWRHVVAALLPPLRNARATVRGAVARAMVLEGGQSMVEYAIVLALVALAAMVAVQALGAGVSTVFSSILAKVQGLGR